MKVCESIDCDRKHYARGMCYLHYNRWWRKGEEPAQRAKVQLLTEVERLLSRREVTASGCWRWTGGTNGVGYGVTTVRYRRLYVHRLSYALAAGPIPDGLVIDHLCRNRACFNPEHLEAVTQQENILRSPLVTERTQCRQGHRFTPENTYTSPAGSRTCKTCRTTRNRRYRKQWRSQSKGSN